MTNPDAEGLLSILVPVYNERAYLRRCIENILSAPLPGGLKREIILVNDASTDGTDQLVDELAKAHSDVLRAFHQPSNQGKGAAIRRAIQEMRGQYAVFQDADLEYDPREYSVLLRPLLEGKADVVYGSRFAAAPMRRVLNYYHTLGNQVLTHLSNLCTGLFVTDMETCYKAFRADVLKTIPIRSDRFGIEPEITAKIAKRGCILYEVPISYHGRSYIEGKKIGWKDALNAVYVILKYRLFDDCYDETHAAALLRNLSRSRQIQHWLADTLLPAMGARILEVNAGFGSTTRFLPKREHLTVTDPDSENVDLLKETYRDNDLVAVHQFSLESGKAFSGSGIIDTVVCLNGLECVGDDTAALQSIFDSLQPGGRLILQVPQYVSLFGSYDSHLGYKRRYSRESLYAALSEVGFHVKWLQNFNCLGVFVWWLNSCLLQRDRIGKYQIKLCDSFVPLQRVLEHPSVMPGLSLLCVAERPATDTTETA